MVAGFFFFLFGFIAEILLLVFCLGFIAMVAKFFWRDSGSSMYCWVVVLGFGWWWVDEKERKIERRRTEMKREERRERDFFYILF